MSRSRRLDEVAPELARILARSMVHTPPRFAVREIRCETLHVPMRDGVRLATDLYLPPTLPAPAIAMRTPYGKGRDPFVGVYLLFARRGYGVVVQDCRGTGESEPDSWDYYVYESEDGHDFVEWVSRQSWFDGFLASCGASYAGQTQWPMATHPRMATIVPEVSGLGIAINTVHLHMFANAYARSVGKGADKLSIPYYELERVILPETLASGFFNEPLRKPLPDALLLRFPDLRQMPLTDARRWLWKQYCSLGSAARAAFIKEVTDARSVSILEIEYLSEIFGHRISHDAHTLPNPDPMQLAASLNAPALMRTGWYDWGLNDALATWDLLMSAAPEPVRARSRLFIAPSAHSMPGYHEGMGEHPELHHAYGVTTNFETLLHWYEAVRENRIHEWPRVIYYLMSANEWRTADAWPVPGARELRLYLHPQGRLDSQPPGGDGEPDQYTYDPNDPTPTVGGSIVSYVYPPGSIDVSIVQRRADVLTYTSSVLDSDLDVVGPLRMILFASSSARDTDFAVRLSDVFPDGRAIQIQNGVLRARYRNLQEEPSALIPGEIYRLEVDLWATANRFKAGHRLRVDVSSADFPRFDRNVNRAGEHGAPIPAEQAIYHDSQRASYLRVEVLDAES